MGSFWIFALGLVAQGLFSARTLVQWVLSEKARKVVNPTIFWILSLGKLYMTLLAVLVACSLKPFITCMVTGCRTGRFSVKRIICLPLRLQE